MDPLFKQKKIFILCIGLVFTSLYSPAHAKKDPLKVLVILAHPDPESFNHSVAKSVMLQLSSKGHEVKVRDLYALGFDPVMTLEEWQDYSQKELPPAPEILEEQQAVLWANHLIFIYPTWWWSPPAILKGYFDRVFTPDFAFDANSDPSLGLLKNKKVIIIQTTGAPEEFVVGEGMDAAVKKLMQAGVFGFLEMEVLHHEFLTGINGKTYNELKTVLEEVELLISQLF
jgi:NAD(P)H dehydrogenase (quinone)